MNRDKLAKEVLAISHLTGTFTLRSGQVSHQYFDKYRFESQPKLLKPIAEFMAKLIPSDTQALAGLEMGGIPIATALSFETGLPVVFVRKKAKDYGTCRFAEGLEVRGQKLCVIEDVITTGGQVLESVQALRADGAVIDTVLCCILRGDKNAATFRDLGLSVRELFTMQELLSHQ